MSVEDFDSIDGVVEFLGDQTPQDCFFCGKPLAGFTTMWHGLSSRRGDGFDVVALHPDCAIELATYLCRDGLNAKFLAEGKSPLLGVPVELRGR